jgi:hypothetical protein
MELHATLLSPLEKCQVHYDRLIAQALINYNTLLRACSDIKGNVVYLTEIQMALTNNKPSYSDSDKLTQS